MKRAAEEPIAEEGDAAESSSSKSGPLKFCCPVDECGQYKMWLNHLQVNFTKLIKTVKPESNNSLYQDLIKF